MPSQCRFSEIMSVDVSASRGTFHAVDYSVLAVTLAFSMAIGVYYALKGRKSTSAKEYFTADGTMGIIPATFSLLASVICSIWYIGFPAEVYEFGFHWAWDFVMFPFAFSLVAFGFVPVFYDLGVTSANEYLEKRFNKTIRMIGSILYIANSALYVAMVTYIPALSVSQVTGIHLWISIALMTLIGTTYTALGGIRAVMWTDVFQMLVIYASMIAVVAKGTSDVGGISLVFQRAIEGRRIAWPPMTADPRYRYTIGNVILMCSFYWVGLYGTYQTQVQRYLSCPSKKAAQKAVWYNLVAFLTLECIIVYISLLLYAFFHDCDPKLNKNILSYDELLTYFVMKAFRNAPGLPGLFVSGVFSGALSTISSCLNSMAAVTMEDFILAIPRFRKMEDRKRTLLSRWIALIYGILTIGLMTLVERLGSIQTFWGYNNGTIMGCSAGLFMLGLFVPWANSPGALVGLIVTAGSGLFVALGAQILEVRFQSEPLSTKGCNDTKFMDNLTSLVNHTNYIMNETTGVMKEPIPPQWSILSERGGFKEIFTISPLSLQPFTLILTVVIGAIASYCFRSSPKHVGKNLELLSPVIRPFVRRRMNRKINKTESDDVKKECLLQEKDEPCQRFLNGSKCVDKDCEL